MQSQALGSGSGWYSCGGQQGREGGLAWGPGASGRAVPAPAPRPAAWAGAQRLAAASAPAGRAVPAGGRQNTIAAPPPAHPRPSPPDWVCQMPAGALGSRAHVPGAPHWRPQVTARSRGPARNRRRQCKRFAVGLGAGKTPQTGAVPGAGCPGVHRCSPYSKGLGRLCRCTSV